MPPPTSFRRLRRALLPAMALLLALSVTVTAGMYVNRFTLDNLFGRGNRDIQHLDKDTELLPNYYPTAYNSQQDCLDAATTLSQTISDAGIVLLKNNGLLPLSARETISPFGLRYYLPYYGGSGSSAIGSDTSPMVTPAEGLHEIFSSCNQTLETELARIAASADLLSENADLVSTAPLNAPTEGNTLYEFDASCLTGFEDTCSGTIGLVFIGRQTGEDQDASVSPYSDGTPHMLAITRAERDTLAFAKAHCDGVVVVLVTSSPMEVRELELDDGIDAILWLGGAGSTGYASLARVLSGAVNPSGRLPDLWASNFRNDPTFANLDDGSERFLYANATTTLVTRDSWTEDAPTPFREYEEGVYVGYRYYETAFDLGALADYHDPQLGVLYPFGYGLSYTTFSQEIVHHSDNGTTITVWVRVTNTGTQYAGQDVIQLYATPPYTQLDVEYAIEKPTVSLVAFAKSGVLMPGVSEVLELSFAKEDLASYCYTRKNGDGTTGCYMLEAGEYVLTLRADSHTVLDSCTVTQPETLWFDGAQPRTSERLAQSQLDPNGSPLLLSAAETRPAVNRFSTLNAYMTDPSISGAVPLTRANWAGTQPTAPTASDRQASQTVIEWIAQSDTTRPPDFASQEGQTAPLSGQKNGLVLADLRGRSYDDPTWDLLLDQLDYADFDTIRLALFQNAYQTGSIKSIGKPSSIDRDGPQGLTLADVNGENWIDNVCGYPGAPVMAATFDTELLYQFGAMVAQEASFVSVNGWYAPALNLHRSPFGGRASEYFSEDPLLTGMLGAAVISGAGDGGLTCVVKHLAIMDVEAHKNPHTCVWMTEQALREIYLRPFELAIKNATKTIYFFLDSGSELSSRTMRAGDALMAGDSGIGALWAAADRALLTDVVRGEWGFIGTILSDMHLNGNNNQVDWLLLAGCDCLMSSVYGAVYTPTDLQSPLSLMMVRTAIKNQCYTQVNSNLMQGVAPGSYIVYAPASWEIWLIIFNAAVALILLIMGGILIRSAYRERRK